ncbi:RluA family pseudouridine synthase [Pelagicoccus albus]|uniref:Pseudouridine synthase n=1 Tax=Pelagicoccus albus TaxID=415222 RepID=A0A7X1E9B1_9BACT|nr:RluA family pseudouridine synthase [Pelagicoccus albus]
MKNHFQLPWGKARSWIDTGKVFIDGNCVTDQGQPVRAGQRIELRMSAPKKRPAPRMSPKSIIYFDEELVVVNKAAGVMSVPHPESEEVDTLDRLTLEYLRYVDPKARSNRSSLGVVHRIDKDTSGLLVFARSYPAQKALSEQFRAHSIERRYLALVHGYPKSQTIQTRIARDAGEGIRGSVPEGTTNAMGEEFGREAITHVEVLEKLEGASLVACRIETGRTHQIRIHLSELGHPIIGDKVYSRGFEGELIPAGRTMLHAEQLGFLHPRTGESLKWTEQPSKDFQRIYKGLKLRKLACSGKA